MVNDRKLSANEEALEILNSDANSFNIVVICKVTGFLTEEIVRQALGLLQKRHPRLNCRIVGELNHLRFETANIEIPLRVAEKQYKEQHQEVILNEINQKIESDKSLMRVVLVPITSESNVNYIITTLHHAIADGVSCMQLHSDILTYCQKIVSSEPMTEIVSLPALPSIEELLPERLQGWKGKLKILLAIAKIQLKHIWYKPQNLRFEKFVPIELRHTGMVQRSLNEQQTTQLINICRQNKTTVHSALCAAMVFAAASKIIGAKKTDVTVSSSSTFNLRKLLKQEVSAEHLGVLASVDIAYHVVKVSTFFWDVARDTKRQIEASLKSGSVFCAALFFKQYLKSSLAHPENVSTVSVTNIGKINIPKSYGSFELEEISFASSMAVFKVFFVTVATFQEKMYLNFMYSKPTLSQQTVELLADNVIACILETCNNENLSFSNCYNEDICLGGTIYN